MNALLASTSTLHGGGYLDYLESDILSLFQNRTSPVFIPFARPGGRTWSEYSALATERFSRMGIELRGLESFESPRAAIERADGFFVGGGNSFVLLQSMIEFDLLDAIRDKIKNGCPYMGSSAGSNLAGMSIGTTNDMPIVHPRSLEALGLLNFNINPHYLDPSAGSTHMGETREMRISEFHVFNEQAVLGLRESSWLRIEGEKTELKGPLSARLFCRGKAPRECAPGLLDTPELRINSRFI